METVSSDNMITVTDKGVDAAKRENSVSDSGS